jgi:HAD superfamily hydrolase (TIGR01549 family)
MTKAIIFDFWGTLVENGVWSPIKQVQNILQIRLPFSEYVIRMERAMMTQKHPSLKDAFKAVCTEFSIEPREHKIEQLIGLWNKSWMLAKPYENTMEILKKLKKTHRLILISNTDSASVNNVLEKFALKCYFHNIYLSCDTGLLKTDPEFLPKVLQENQLKPDDCLLIGDSVQSDVKAAEQANIKAILIDHKDRRDFQNKITSLQQIEGKL